MDLKTKMDIKRPIIPLPTRSNGALLAIFFVFVFYSLDLLIQGSLRPPATFKPTPIPTDSFKCQYLDGNGYRGSSRLCNIKTDLSYTRGEWRQTCTADHIRDRWNQYAYGHDTPRDFKYYCRPNRSEVLQWNWYPSSCELFPFYPLEMQARILTKRKILFIGDSLLEELSYSMSVLSGVTLNWTRSCTLVDYHTTRPMPPGHFRFCQCRHNGTNCELAPKTAPSGLICPEGQVAQHRESRNYEWTSMIRDYNTLVISVGHHWRKEDPQFERYPEMVENILTYLSENFGGLIIYMMAPMGHLGCSNYRKPITQDQLATFKRPNEKYMWLEAVYAQEHWLRISRNIPALNDRFYILNTTMLMYRPDGHIEGFKNDCLHWCLPGPIDTIAHLLFNLLMQLQMGY